MKVKIMKTWSVRTAIRCQTPTRPQSTVPSKGQPLCPAIRHMDRQVSHRITLQSLQKWASRTSTISFPIKKAVKDWQARAPRRSIHIQTCPIISLQTPRVAHTQWLWSDYRSDRTNWKMVSNQPWRSYYIWDDSWMMSKEWTCREARWSATLKS